MEKIRELLGVQLALKKGLSLFKKEDTIVELELKEIMDLAKDYSIITKSFEEAMIIPDADIDRLNQRYNKYFSDYLNEVKPHKKKYNQALKNKNIILNSTSGLDDHINWMNHLDYIEKIPGSIMKFEKYLPQSAGYLRKELPQVSYKDIDWILSKLNDENVVINRISIPISQLKPTQKNFKKKKIITILRTGMKDKEFVPLVSKDLFILDGHHRWGSLLEEDEDQIIDVYLINMNIPELVARLNKAMKLEKAALIIVLQGRDQGLVSDKRFQKILCQVKNIHHNNYKNL
ncbi:MAG TPA: hypothetical protein ENH06_00010 [bacterium]|nr:hypothetical protein [bacterium]